MAASPGDQICLLAELVDEARQRLAAGGIVLIDEKSDGSIVVGLTCKVAADQKPVSSSLT